MTRIVNIEKVSGFVTEFRRVFDNKISKKDLNKTNEFVKECKSDNKKPSEVFMDMFVEMRNS